jgi:sulfatase maturation enzyme AslB (radical SAM superfamily)
MTKFDYNSSDPIGISLDSLDEHKQFLLTESKTFCIYPWIHLHAYPTGEAYPCCHSEMWASVGSCKQNTLEEIWNDEPMRRLRKNMLSDKPSAGCSRCYEQEKAGFMSGRVSANKHHGHHILKVDGTDGTGQLDKFEMSYWDIRFSNLCNLRCRSCGHIFSSQWYQDQAKLAGADWAKNNKVLNIAGREEADMWNQLLPHIDYVEQIYFAGGEPLLMQEHYNILEELVRRGMFHVRLIYNTNFTHTQLKDKSVFDYWRLFDSVSVGASLDGADHYAEYIRKGTDWQQVEQNRRDMIRICPNVDFYISPTLSIMNAWHLPDFHRNWVERGFIRHQDLNVNILQDPDFYRIDIAGAEYKQELKERFEQHLAWLRPHDTLQRATVGFESAINFMMAKDNTALQSKFFERTHQLDGIRGENIFEVIPELNRLNADTTR